MRFFLIGLFSLILFTGLQVHAQTVVITDNSTYTTGQASSVLDVYSVSKGFLAPRMTQAQRIAISTPSDGLLVYQTDQSTKGFYFYNATTSSWTSLATSLASSSNWSLTGNSGTNSGTNFLGTIDKISLRFRTNNIQRLLIDSVGNISFTGNTTITGTTTITSNTSVGGNLTVTGSNTTTGATVMNGTVQVGSVGSSLTSIIKANFTLTNNTSFDYNSVISFSVPVTNAAIGSVVYLSPTSTLSSPLFIAYAYVKTAGNLYVVIGNSGNAATLGTVTFNAIIIN